MIDTLFRRIGIYDDIQKERVLLIYHEIVGKKFSEFSHAERFEDGILWVKIDHPVWKQELLFFKKMIVEKYKLRLNSNMVKDIKLL